jgi:hypothetical protein
MALLYFLIATGIVAIIMLVYSFVLEKREKQS